MAQNFDTKPYWKKVAHKEAFTEAELVALLTAVEAYQAATAYLADCNAATLNSLPKSTSKSAKAKMSISEELVGLIERKTGASIAEIQSVTISERRLQVEKKVRAPMRLLRMFPFIGRGSVMGKLVLSHQEVNRQLDHALR